MRWSWPRDLSGLLGQVLMESLCLYAYVLVITAFSTSRMSWIEAAAPQLGCALLGWSSRRLRLRVPLQRALLVAACAGWLAIWLHWVAAPQVVWVWLIALYGGARGVLAAVAEQTGVLAARWFMIGAVAILCLFLFLAGARVPPIRLPSARLHAVTLIYFAWGMLVVAAATRRSLYASERLRPPRFSLAFAVATVVPAVLAALAALALAAGLRTARWVLATLLRAADWSASVLWAVVRTLGYVLHGLFTWLGQLGGQNDAAGPRDAARARPQPLVELWNSQLREWSVPDWNVVPALFVAVAALLLTTFLMLLFRARPRAEEAEAIERSESLWSWTLALQQWRSFVQSLASALRVRGTRALQSSSNARDDAGLRDIREVYRAMQRWAAARGHARSRDTTTLELASELARDPALETAEVSPITRSYNDARYGDRSIDEPELERARQQLRALLERNSAPPPSSERESVES